MAEDIVLDEARPLKQTSTSVKLAQDPDLAELRKRAKEAHQDYGRGRKIPVKSIKDKKLRRQLRTLEDKYKDATLKAKDAEILLENEPGFLEPESELERTYKVRQDELRKNIDIETAKKGFELKLKDFGPYIADYTRNGKQLLLAGRKGHVSTMDWGAGKLGCELQLQETVRDATWLHNDQYFAVSQKKYVYIYDHAGVELHCLKNHIEATNMEFLPYHFLLATVGNSGYLRYTDTSTGRTVSEFPTRQGTPTALSQNPWNAILNVGHQNGTVTLWSPSSTTPLVKLLSHHGPVRSTAVDRSGRYMVTAGQDQQMKVWDIRTYKELNAYFLRQPGASLAISDRDCVAVGWGTQTSIWRGLFSRSRGTSTDDDHHPKIQSPYMSWGGEGSRIERLSFCPYEDVLGISHSDGFTSILVPGAGESNFDALEANPYESTKQRQEAEVKSLLHKLQPEMISLDPDFVGNLDMAGEEQRRREKDLDRKEEDPVLKLKNRGRGKNSSLRKYLRKKGGRNILDERREKIEAMRQEQNRRTRVRKEGERDRREELGPALGRFVGKRKAG